MGAGNGSELAGLSDRELLEQALRAVRGLDGRDGELYMQMGKLVAELSRAVEASSDNAAALRETTTVLRQILPRLAARERMSSRPDLISVDALEGEDSKARLEKAEAQVAALTAARDGQLAADARDEARFKRVRNWVGLVAAIVAVVGGAATGFAWLLGHLK